MPGGTDTDGPLPQPELEGVRVECCFVVTDQNGFSGVGCTTETDSPCLDPSDPAVDLDGDGMLSGPEATAVCRSHFISPKREPGPCCS